MECMPQARHDPVQLTEDEPGVFVMVIGFLRLFASVLGFFAEIFGAFLGLVEGLLDWLVSYLNSTG